MPAPHKRTYRHPKYKTAYRVKNWRDYNQALRDQGDITVWISHEAIEAWTPPHTGKRDAQPRYADIAIETALSLRLLFHLPLCQSEGFLRSILTLMSLDLPCPDHTTLSRRNTMVTITRHVRPGSQEPADLLIDHTGMKVCGQGKWHGQKHGEKKRRHWKKLHIDMDNEGWIIAQAITESHEHDPSQVPALFAHVDGPIAHSTQKRCGVESHSYDVAESTRSVSAGDRMARECATWTDRRGRSCNRNRCMAHPSGFPDPLALAALHDGAGNSKTDPTQAQPQTVRTGSASM